ncbi:MAG: indole-3-glycerol-phosphate synthase [Sorangiineae bacterium]|nr:indole-3-glycerol-phosphate synthase [Polyangiaceae bacterium]MEB2323815.1 indole-3-glycerol-phosphate synthase [Sorangiineae bacterium]
MSLLARILAEKARELPGLRARRLPAPPPRRAVELGRRAGGPLALIAEFKRRSPSAGELSRALSLEERVARYARGGARAVSVLTDGAFFGGRFEDLTAARAAACAEGRALPILCKDFIIDEAQLDAARAFGADLALIIVRCLAPARITRLVGAARERGLEPLVEVVTEDEARLALDAGARLIGVNARDLDTLALDAARAAGVLARLPAQVVAVHLSGLRTPADLAQVAGGRAEAALIGEALMRADDPEPLLAAMVAAARGPSAP